MRHLLILTVGVCLLFASVPAMAGQAEDEAAIRKIMKQREAAYNRHDVTALGAQLDETYESWTGSQKGRSGYEKYTA